MLGAKLECDLLSYWYSAVQVELWMFVSPLLHYHDIFEGSWIIVHDEDSGGDEELEGVDSST